MLLRREFEKFLVIFEEGSLSKAADRLDNYQGALSKVLVKIEDELGTQLFIRSNRGLVPTAEGQKLYDQVQLQRELWEGYRHNQDYLSTEVMGVLRVGGHESVLAQFTDQLAKVHRKFPRLEVEYHFDRSPRISRMVLNHELDIAFVANPQPFADLVIRQLKTENVALYSKEGSPEGFIAYNPELISANSVLKSLSSKNARLIAAKDHDFAAKLARSLKGSAILPESVAFRNQLKKQVGRAYFIAKVCLIYRADHRTDQRVVQVIQALG